jgi:hypothetical protein
LPRPFLLCADVVGFWNTRLAAWLSLRMAYLHQKQSDGRIAEEGNGFVRYGSRLTAIAPGKRRGCFIADMPGRKRRSGQEIQARTRLATKINAESYGISPH